MLAQPIHYQGLIMLIVARDPFKHWEKKPVIDFHTRTAVLIVEIDPCDNDKLMS